MTAGAPGWPGHKFALVFAAVVLAASILVVGFTMRSAALPPDAHGKLIAVFAPGMGEEHVFAALTRAGGRPPAAGAVAKQPRRGPRSGGCRR